MNILVLLDTEGMLTDSQWSFVLRMLKDRRARVVIRGSPKDGRLAMWSDHPRVRLVSNTGALTDHDFGWSEALMFSDWVTLVEVYGNLLPSPRGLEKMFEALEDVDVALLQPLSKSRGITACRQGLIRRILDLPLYDVTGTIRAWRRDLVEELHHSFQSSSPSEFRMTSLVRAFIAGAVVVEIPEDLAPHTRVGLRHSRRLLKEVWRLRSVRQQLTGIKKVSHVTDLPDW